MTRNRCIALMMCTVVTFGAIEGCSTERDPGDLFAPQGVGTPVVQTSMIVGKPYPEVFLSRAAAPDKPFFIDNQVIVGANITITDDQGIVMSYSERATGGIYTPNALSVLVQPGRTYFLRVVTLEDELITATTTTPDSFSIDSWVLLDNDGATVRRELRTFPELGSDVYRANQLVYADGLLEARFEDLPVPAYQVGVFSLDFDSDLVIDPDFLDEEELAELGRFISSPPLEAIDNALRLPWFAIYYAERYKIQVYALDKNWFDLIRSVPAFGGGPGFGGNVGDGFEKPIFHVEGGIGLFGSASADSIGFFVLPRP